MKLFNIFKKKNKKALLSDNDIFEKPVKKSTETGLNEEKANDDLEVKPNDISEQIIQSLPKTEFEKEKTKDNSNTENNNIIIPNNKNSELELSKKSESSNISIKSEKTSWEISVSFSKSSSANFDRALYLAKHADKYLKTVYNGNDIYQAFFTSNPKSYLDFIKLYELISGWKSTFVMINGELVDRKIVSGLNRCYGDKCRTGKIDFCYGASFMTENPFGCHRLQISSCNHPWWSFSHYNGRKYVVDKKAILERAKSYSTAYRMCPCFDWDKIVKAIEELPNTVDEGISLDEWQQSTFNKNLLKLAIRDAKEMGTDLLEMTEHSPTCAECAKYQGRVYSISGKSNKFPPLPKEFIINDGVHEGCRHAFFPYEDGLSKPNYHENIVEYSNSPFVDNRTPEEVAAYEKEKH